MKQSTYLSHKSAADLTALRLAHTEADRNRVIKGIIRDRDQYADERSGLHDAIFGLSLDIINLKRWRFALFVFLFISVILHIIR